MFRPLISAKVRSTARRSAPWKSRLTGWPVNRRSPVPRRHAPAGGWRLRRRLDRRLRGGGRPRPGAAPARAVARRAAPAVEPERRDRIGRGRVRRGAHRRRAERRRRAGAGRRRRRTASAVRRRPCRRLVEVDDDRVALAAHVVRDRLRQRDADARRAARPIDSAGFDRHRGDRALRARPRPSWRRRRRRRCGSRRATRQRIGPRRDVRHRLGRLDDERRALGVDARADGRQPHAGAVVAAGSRGPTRQRARPPARRDRSRARPLVTVIPWRPRAIAAACAPPAASRATADR